MIRLSPNTILIVRNYYHNVFCEFKTFDTKYNVSYLSDDFKEMTKVYGD